MEENKYKLQYKSTSDVWVTMKGFNNVKQLYEAYEKISSRQLGYFYRCIKIDVKS